MYKKAAGLAAQRGYTNITLFRDGIPGWVKAGYTLDNEKALPKTKIPSLGAQKLNENLDDFVIVDIRPKLLYKMGTIKGSVQIPLALFPERWTEIPKDRKIIVVDHAGKQVLVAARYLKSKGFVDVSRLQGGLMTWAAKGLPLEK